MENVIDNKIYSIDEPDSIMQKLIGGNGCATLYGAGMLILVICSLFIKAEQIQ
jgi:hypothetical protein